MSLSIAVLTLAAASASAQQAGPQKFDDAQKIASLLTRSAIVECLAKFKVARVDSITREQTAKAAQSGYPIGEKHEYKLSGPVVRGDIGTGQQTLTITTEVKMGHFEPYLAYSCEVN